MSEEKSKKIDLYFDNSAHGFKAIFLKIKLLEEINNILKNELDSALGKYCQVANFNDGRLSLLTANASVATQIRFRATELIQKLKRYSVLKNISEIKPMVRPYRDILAETQPIIGPSMQPLSHQTAEFIKQGAESLSGPLKDIMLRIAKNTK